MSDPIYLDHNASTPVPPRIRAAVERALVEGFGNPSAGHVYGRRARAIVEDGRSRVAELLGCQPDEIVYTSGGTEASNLALRGTALLVGVPWLTLITSTLEHPATVEPIKVLVRAGARSVKIPALPSGVIDTAAALEAIAELDGQAIVSLILAQNETGVIQPVAEVARAARAKGALVHVDAAQAVGKIPVRVDELEADLLSVAGHKLYAPKGVGALYVRAGTKIAPLVVGAGHEHGLRPGTENVAGIAGLGEACAMALEDLESEQERQATLRDRLEAKLAQAGFVTHGATCPRLPNTTNGRFPGVRGSRLLEAVPELAFTTGSACHAGVEEPSAVLTSMGIAAEDALGAIRLSLGRGTTEAEVDRAAELLIAAASRLS